MRTLIEGGNGSLIKPQMAAFRTEVELGVPVVQWLRGQGYSVIGHEVDAGVGVPDLVAGRTAAAELRRRKRQAAPIVDPLQLMVLDFCVSPRSEDDLRAWAPNGYAPMVRRALTPLVDRGLIVMRNGVAKTSRDIKDPLSWLVAVELKLSDASRGLRQAHSYRIFADSSYLAMPSDRFSSRTLQAARDAGIGLLSIEPHAVVEIVAPDLSSFATPGRRRVASERTLAASSNSNQRPAGSRRGRALLDSV